MPVTRSRDEIERTLKRYGCDQQLWMRDDTVPNMTLGFVRKGLTYKLTVPLPKQGYKFTIAEADAETMRRFRVLLIWLKATCEMVDTGLLKFEEAFMPHTLTPGGQTAGQLFGQQIAVMLESGRAPSLMLALPAGRQ